VTNASLPRYPSYVGPTRSLMSPTILPDFPPITPEDLTKLGVALQLIPFIVSTTLRAEESPNGSPALSPGDAGTLVEILDKVCLPMRGSHPLAV